MNSFTDKNVNIFTKRYRKKFVFIKPAETKYLYPYFIKDYTKKIITTNRIRV